MEAGNDDCGDSLAGLGPGVSLLGLDLEPREEADSDEENHGELFYQIPQVIPDGLTDVFSAIAGLCYGYDNSVDLLELCGGTGGISKAAFRRKLSAATLTTQRSKRRSCTTWTRVTFT